LNLKFKNTWMYEWKLKMYDINENICGIWSRHNIFWEKKILMLRLCRMFNLLRKWREKHREDHINNNENKSPTHTRIRPPSTQNLKTLCLWVFFLICCSTVSFLLNVRLRLSLEYLTIHYLRICSIRKYPNSNSNRESHR